MRRSVACVILLALAFAGCSPGSSDERPRPETTPATSSSTAAHGVEKLSDFSGYLTEAGFVLVDEWEHPVPDDKGTQLFQYWESTSGRYVTVGDGIYGPRVLDIGQVLVGKWAYIKCVPKNTKLDLRTLSAIAEGEVNIAEANAEKATRSSGGWYVFDVGRDKDIECGGFKVTGKK